MESPFLPLKAKSRPYWATMEQVVTVMVGSDTIIDDGDHDRDHIIHHYYFCKETFIT